MNMRPMVSITYPTSTCFKFRTTDREIAALSSMAISATTKAPTPISYVELVKWTFVNNGVTYLEPSRIDRRRLWSREAAWDGPDEGKQCSVVRIALCISHRCRKNDNNCI